MHQKKDRRSFSIYVSTHRKLLQLRVLLYPATLIEIVDRAVSELLDRLEAGEG